MSVRAVYVVLSYRDADQVVRLATALRRLSPGCLVRVEHDGRRAPAPSIDVPGVTVRAHGLNSDWGSWEEALIGLEGLRRARHETDAELFVLISGQDYPVKCLEAWESEVLAGDSMGWVTGAQLSYRPRWGRAYGSGQDDWTRYAYRWWRSPLQPSPEAVDWLVRGFRWVEPIAAWRVMERGRGSYVGLRRIPAPFSASEPVWKGWPWCALRRPLLDRMLAIWDSDHALRRVFRHTIIPAEAVLPTLARRTGLGVADRDLAFTDWTNPREAPAVLGRGHLDAIVQADAPFCRKLEPERSAGLLDELDALTR